MTTINYQASWEVYFGFPGWLFFVCLFPGFPPPVPSPPAEFSKEKNVTQRDVMEGALIEYLQKYGFKREIETLLKNE